MKTTLPTNIRRALLTALAAATIATSASTANATTQVFTFAPGTTTVDIHTAANWSTSDKGNPFVWNNNGNGVSNVANNANIMRFSGTTSTIKAITATFDSLQLGGITVDASSAGYSVSGNVNTRSMYFVGTTVADGYDGNTKITIGSSFSLGVTGTRWANVNFAVDANIAVASGAVFSIFATNLNVTAGKKLIKTGLGSVVSSATTNNAHWVFSSTSIENSLNLNNYGGANTTIEFSNAVGGAGVGYFLTGTNTFNQSIIFTGSGAGGTGVALKMDSGYSGANYTFSGSISGAGTFEKLSGPSDNYYFTGNLSNFAGGIDFSTGGATLSLGSGGAYYLNGGIIGTGAASNVFATGTKTLTVNYSNNVVLQASVTGAGGITKLGAGTLTIAGTTSGTITVSVGAINVTDLAKLTGSTWTIANNAALEYSGATTGSKTGLTLNGNVGTTGSWGISVSGAGALNLSATAGARTQSFVKLGSGELIWSAGNLVTGAVAVNINDGKLTIASANLGSYNAINLGGGTLNNTTTLSLGTGKTLAGVASKTGSVAGSVTLAGGSINAAQVGANVTINSLDFAASSLGSISLYSTGIETDTIQALHVGTLDFTNLSASNKLTINIVEQTSDGTLGNGSYTLIAATTVIGTVDADMLTLGNIDKGGRQSFDYTAASGTGLVLEVSGYLARLTWLGNSPEWLVNDDTDTASWSGWNKTEGEALDAADSYFQDNDEVLFSTIGGSALQTITVNDTTNTYNMTVSGDDTDYTFTGTGKLTGGMHLTKDGESTLTLNLTSDYAGGTIMNAGTLNLTAANALGTGGLVVNNGEVNATFAHALGTGLLTINGGDVNISAAQTISGAALAGGIVTLTDTGTLGAGNITFSGGTLNYGINSAITFASQLKGNVKIDVGATAQSWSNFGSASLQLLAGTVTLTGVAAGVTGHMNYNIASGAKVIHNFGNSTTGFISGLTGNGYLHIKPTVNSFAINGWQTFTGTLEVTAGGFHTFIQGTANTAANRFSLIVNGDSSFGFVLGTTAASTTYINYLSGTGIIRMDGGGGLHGLDLEMRGSNAYDGQYAGIPGGTNREGGLRVSSLGVTSFTLTLSNASSGTGTATLTVDNAIVKFIGSGKWNGAVTVNATGTLLFANTATVEQSANILGTGKVEIDSTTIVTLSGTNSYTGGTTITNGTLVAGSASAFGTGAVTMAASTTLDLNSKAVTNAITYNGGTLSGYDAYTGTMTLNADWEVGDVNPALNAGASVVVDSTAEFTLTGTAVIGDGTTHLFTLTSLTNGGELTFNLLNEQNTMTAGTYWLLSTYTGGTATGSLGWNESILDSTLFDWAWTDGAGTGTALGLVITSITPPDVHGNPVTWVGGVGGDGVWNTNTTNKVWTSGTSAVADYFADTNDVIFGIGSFGEVTIDGTVTPGTITVTGGMHLLVADETNGGSIAGESTTLTVTGGSIALNLSNTYEGGTTVSGGTLLAGHASALSTGAVAISGGTLDLNSLAISNDITYTGGNLTGYSAYTGELTLNADWEVGDVNPALNAGASVVVGSTAEFTLTGTAVTGDGTTHLFTLASLTNGGELTFNLLNEQNTMTAGTYWLLSTYTGGTATGSLGWNESILDSTLFDWAWTDGAGTGTALGLVITSITPPGPHVVEEGEYPILDAPDPTPYSLVAGVLTVTTGGSAYIDGSVTGTASVTGTGSLTMSGAGANISGTGTLVGGNITVSAGTMATGTMATGTLEANELSGFTGTAKVDVTGSGGTFDSVVAGAVTIASGATVEVTGVTTLASVALAGELSVKSGAIANVTFSSKTDGGSIVVDTGGELNLGGAISIVARGSSGSVTSTENGEGVWDPIASGVTVEFASFITGDGDVNANGLVLSLDFFDVDSGAWAVLKALATENPYQQYTFNLDLGYDYSGSSFALIGNYGDFIVSLGGPVGGGGDSVGSNTILTGTLSYLPEPTTATMGILGLAGLLLRRRRRATR